MECSSVWYSNNCDANCYVCHLTQYYFTTNLAHNQEIIVSNVLKRVILIMSLSKLGV